MIAHLSTGIGPKSRSQQLSTKRKEMEPSTTTADNNELTEIPAANTDNRKINVQRNWQEENPIPPINVGSGTAVKLWSPYN